ncbi:DNA (cytosine-5-)-methyltransferase [Prauserella marina]|uniref:DNA (Cytosine-5)-methyltransferase 1 n=1 Tax=Prauserella marina TaxID=530584 RepID=A0A222VI96_9PSEU|nr:DNA cytosine methyltransferase [Prauserella marina]ASR33650.1 DNA (cytosine-5-)-methyltransferase [Prauserella marina]PWV82193.1 DNA (cytosine-5)-methyltransferase 1 [Prauserella marina]SDD21324.1 DNA (cytosine-5)-methyltransferase 1 [Prauserella marina]
MAIPEAEKPLKVVEICAGAGGQALGLKQAGFEHELAIELDPTAADTLRRNLRAWHGFPERAEPESSRAMKSKAKKPLVRTSVEIVDGVITGDVAAEEVWEKAHKSGVALPEGFDLLAGGVPCPPFSLAGQQRGSTDERDLFAWAVHQCQILKPRALLLENVRGLSMPRFSGYRQEILDRLIDMKYVAEWRLLNASDFGVPQLRPRFVLIALQEEFAPYFHWPEPQGDPLTVGETLRDLMGARGWKGLDQWVAQANNIAPTVVGGSKKHGGADLGPTRAKKAWAQLGVDAWGIADHPPAEDDVFEVGPKLTTEMVQLLQGWPPSECRFAGLKTSKYRQVGNAFPPPVAKAVGLAIKSALLKHGDAVDRDIDTTHDPIYRALRNSGGFMTAAQISRAVGKELEAHELEHRISLLSKDFEVEIQVNKNNVAAFKLGEFRAFVGQANHLRHDLFNKNKSKIS